MDQPMTPNPQSIPLSEFREPHPPGGFQIDLTGVSLVEMTVTTGVVQPVYFRGVPIQMIPSLSDGDPEATRRGEQVMTALIRQLWDGTPKDQIVRPVIVRE